jgi:hypothetical protein
VAANNAEGETMNTRNQLLCAWSGVAFAILFTIGFWPLTHFMPPPSPTVGALDVAAMYQAHTNQIRLGLLVMMGASGCILPFAAVISAQMKRMEDTPSVLSYLQLASGAVGVVFFIVPCLIWSVAAFRPERDPALIQLMNDAGWLMFLMPFTTFMVQNFAIGIAILGDKSAQPVFPRWVAFLNFWVAVLFLPGGLLTFFKTGPFAWNGLFAFWVPFVVFFTWYMVMFTMLRKGIIAQDAALGAR